MRERFINYYVPSPVLGLIYTMCLWKVFKEFTVKRRERLKNNQNYRNNRSIKLKGTSCVYKGGGQRRPCFSSICYISKWVESTLHSLHVTEVRKQIRCEVAQKVWQSWNTGLCAAVGIKPGEQIRAWQWKSKFEWHPGKRPIKNFPRDTDGSRFPFKNRLLWLLCGRRTGTVKTAKGMSRQKDTAKSGERLQRLIPNQWPWRR